jgi:hypothetical protein
MKYQKVQGFRVADTWEIQTQIATDRIIRTQWIDLVKGLLVMKQGFCFEGSAPGPKWLLKALGILGKKSKRGYCAHDAIYDLIRNGHIEPFWKEAADDLMNEIHLKDRMARPAAKIVHRSVVSFADFAIDPANRIKIQTAP